MGLNIANITPRISFLMAELGHGGIGKMRVHLTRELVERGLHVDLLLGRDHGPYLPMVDPRVRVIKLGSSHALRILPPLIRYLRANRPDALICEKLRVNLAAHRACRLAGVAPKVFASIHGVLSHKLEAESLSRRKQAKNYREIAKVYPRNAGFIAVSTGIAEDLAEVFQVDRARLHVVFNPVVTDEMLAASQAPPAHPWLTEKTTPVIISVGRLEPQKNFPTLIRAIGQLRTYPDARLLILGDGKERAALTALVDELDLAARVQLLGFVPNPYALMARADVFVLASRWEGFGNVIVEALALGTPVVSTDCPAGPREILANGRFGRLVPIDDAASMAAAIDTSLSEPVDTAMLRDAGARYTPRSCANDYLHAIGLDDPQWMRP